MSRHHMEKVTCPSCHHEGDFELWDSINTALDPEMKEKVLMAIKIYPEISLPTGCSHP